MEKLRFELTHGGAVAEIVLNAPKANVLDQAMMQQLLRHLSRLKESADVKLICFSGEGANFCLGASVAEHQKADAPAMLRTFHQLFYELIKLEVPTLAKVWGFCLGGGMELALMCNFIFADESARFGQPEITLGVFAPPASLLLPMKIGQAKAEPLLITGKTISAAEAQALGLVQDVYPDKMALSTGVDHFIKKHILPKSASSLKFAVRTARTGWNAAILKRLPLLEKIYLEELMETEDANEGIAAFLEKRDPMWHNA